MSDLVNIRAAVGHDFAVLQHPLKLLSVMPRYCFERIVFPNVRTRPVAGVVGALDVTQEMQNISTHDEASFQKPASEKPAMFKRKKKAQVKINAVLKNS